MASKNISITDALLAHAEQQIASGRYDNMSEYVRSLIRHDQEKAYRQRLDQLLVEGLSSGKNQTVDAEDWAEIRATARARFDANAKKTA
ncbi:MAG: type II toxin-antitoxin system ParD family antitoxin [Algisphaera sp.]